MIDVPPEPPPQQEQTIEERLIECGLDGDGVSISFDKLLDETVVVIDESAGATADTLGCIREVVGFSPIEFASAELGRTYWDFAAEQERPRRMAEAEEHLAELGLLEGFPLRSDFAEHEDYLRALERHAGVTEGDWLSGTDGQIAFEPPLAKPSEESSVIYENAARLLTVLNYTFLLEGIHFGFIGNERALKD